MRERERQRGRERERERGREGERESFIKRVPSPWASADMCYNMILYSQPQAPPFIDWKDSGIKLTKM